MMSGRGKMGYSVSQWRMWEGKCPEQGLRERKNARWAIV
jgi:hypothetical protein